MKSNITMEFDGRDAFIHFKGKRIAKRGHPDTAQAKTWVSLEPGWRVLDGGKYPHMYVVVEFNGVEVH